MRLLTLLSALVLLTFGSCTKDDDNNPQPPTVDDLLTKHTWQAEEIDVVYTNLSTDHYERSASGNTINYDSDSLKFNVGGTGIYYYQGVAYNTTWTWLNAGKTALRLVIAYPTPVTVDQTNILVSETEFTYTQTKTGDYVATCRRIPRNGITSPPTTEELLIAHMWQAQEIDVTYNDLSTDHYERTTSSNTRDYDSDSIKYNAGGTGTYYYEGVAYNTTWSWSNAGKTALSLTIAFPSPVTLDQSDIDVSTTELTYIQTKTGDYSAACRRIPRDGTVSPGTIEGRLTALTWKAQEIDVTYANTTTDHYIRGGSANTINYDSDSIKFNANLSGSFYYLGIEYSTTWNWQNDQQTDLFLVINYPTPVTLNLTGIVVSSTEFTYTQVKTGDYTAICKRVPN